jgi:hypothetical protein
MNSWNFNELTQADMLDFKACKHNVTGKIYGIKESASCQQGKEIDKAELSKLATAANKGDMKAKKQLEEYRKADKESKKATKKAKDEAEAKKKKAEEEAGKKKKGGKGKKGGGKGKKGGAGKKGGGKGKGKGGGGKAEPAAKKAPAADNSRQKQQSKQAAMKRARDTVQKLQKMLRDVQDPEARKQIKSAIGDLLKSVVDATKSDIGGGDKPAAGQIQGQVQQQQQQEKQGEA